MRYSVEIIDHGGRTFSCEVIDAPDDSEAIRYARRIFTTGIARAFEIRRDRTLVHREQLDGLDGATAGSGDYMACFYDAVGTLMGRCALAAESDDEAQDTAAVLYDACSDVCSYYELWKGRTAVRKAQYFVLAPTATELSRRTQQIVLDREIAIRDSQWHIADSRRLLDAMNSWSAAMRSA